MIDDWDDAYANSPHIAGGADFPRRWSEAAAAFRQGMGARLRDGIDYGSHPRQRFDLFLPEGRPAGLLVFVHGGYWQAFDRGDWSHLAAGPLARGWAVAIPGYVLAPEARVAAMTAMIREAIAAAAGEVEGPIRLAGHSAGGHLVARQVCADSLLPEAVRARIGRVVPISALTDLRPILRTGLNRALRLDLVEARAESPALAEAREGALVHLWVGGDERPEFVRQSALLANVWAGLGVDTRLTIEPGRHHFDVIEGLCDPASDLLEAIVGGAG
jgi:acetyl esterase/lipase